MKSVKENEFPIEVLAEELQTIIKEVSERNKWSVNTIASTMLLTCGNALSNCYEMKIRNNWIERSNIWLIHIANSGNGKSHILKELTLPVKQLNNRLKKTYNSEMAIYEQYEAEKKKGTLKNEDNIDLHFEYCNKEFGVGNIPLKPQKIHSMMSSFTFESLEQCLSVENNNGRSLLIRYDEIAGFFKSMNQYRKGSDEELLLKLFNYEGNTTDRIDDSKNRVIDEQTVSILGTAQPTAMYGMFTEDRINNGAIYRFLYTIDNSNTPVNPFQGLNVDSLNYEPLESYYKMVDSFQIGFESQVSRDTIIMNNDCFKFLENWRNELNTKKTDIGQNMHNSIMGKMDSYIMRIAIILNRTRKYYENDLNNLNLDVIDLEGSKKILDFFITNTVKQINLVSVQTNQYFENDKEAEFFNDLPETFTHTEFINAYQSTFKVSTATAKRRIAKWKLNDVIGKNAKQEYYKK